MDEGSTPEVFPRYRDLPVVAEAPPRSAWGLWGQVGTDVLGRLNLMTPQRVVAATGAVRTGRVFSLDLDTDVPSPPLFGRPAYRHEVTRPETRAHSDRLFEWDTQSSSQWDGFRHIAHPEHGYYDGVAAEEHGVHHWAGRIVGRCVLVDVGRWRADGGRPLTYDESEPITVDDLRRCLSDQGTAVQPGDVLLVRTGWTSWYRSLAAEARVALADDPQLAFPGLMPGEDMLEFLWDLQVAAVAADNPGLEVFPVGVFADRPLDPHEDPLLPDDFAHSALLPLLGMPIGELFDLDALAVECAKDSRYEAMFVSSPLRLPHATGSPPNAVAIR